MTTQERLLLELEECRWFLMGQLADDCEERGEVWEAAGWRWLVEHKRFPSGRVKEQYGWTLRNMGEEPDRAFTKLINLSSHYLPFHLDQTKVPSGTTKNLKKLLKRTAVAVGKYLKKEFDKSPKGNHEI